jgi:predicted ATP-dependent endonuclease of OLD family
MKLHKVRIKNFKSIKDSGDIYFSSDMHILAGQNESGKSSILEALQAFETNIFPDNCVNFEEFQKGNTIESVTCTFKIFDSSQFAILLKKELALNFKIENEDFLDLEIIEAKLKEIPLTKNYEDETEVVELITSKEVIGIVQSAIRIEEETDLDDSDNQIIKKPYINLTEVMENSKKFAKVLFSLVPEIVLFNDFSDLLPDSIAISELKRDIESTKGYKAVRNIEKIIGRSFVDISEKARSVGVKNAIVSVEVEKLSINFQNDWKQRIYGNNKVEIIFNIENDDEGNKTVYFFIKTKDNELLEPKMRSKGMIWFLSAWLELKARENENKLVVLYDEPGLYLHIKAHKDILKVFESLTDNGHQVIYSTHSPSLININRLSNISLVINNEKKGTMVEGLTTSKISTKNKQDALQPIAEAMGLEPLKDFSILSKNNVLLEGLSDFWYFQSIAKVLNRELNYKFVPCIGVKGSKIDALISFCVGYGLNWLLVMDNGVNPKATKERLKTDLFIENEVDNKINLIPFGEIENMFSVSDLILVDSNIKKDDNRIPSKIISTRKIVFAKMFSEKVNTGEILKDDLANSTIKNFEDIFNWIDDKFKEYK